MAIKFEVIDKNEKILVSSNEVIGYEYEYNNKNSTYAKTTNQSSTLKITGDISRFIERSPEELGKIRSWASQKYIAADDYKNVTVKNVVENGLSSYRDDNQNGIENNEDVTRLINFTDARVFSYNEQVNPYTGHGTFEVVFVQREDKLKDVYVEPYNDEFKELAFVEKNIVAASASTLPNEQVKKPYKLDIIEMTFEGSGFIPLRKNYNGIVVSAWEKNTSSEIITGFVGDGKTTKFKINAKFKFSDSNGDNVPIKALILEEASSSEVVDVVTGAVTGAAPSGYPISNEVIVQREKGSLINWFPTKTNYAVFEFSDLGVNGFSRKSINIAWQYKDNSDAWTTMRSIPVTVYYIPNKPNLPWIINESNNSQNPWTDALDMLLTWGVNNMSDKTDIATQITTYVNSSLNLKYDTSMGASKYCVKQGYFKSTSFISDAKSKTGAIVNCTDCATIVSTFSNLIGANLYQVRFENTKYRGIFYCNKIISIGYKTWEYPFGDSVSGGFSYHEIAFDSGKSYTSKIYDACLKVNENAISGGGYKELLPVNKRFASKETYLQLLTASDVAYYKELLVVNVMVEVDITPENQLNLVNISGYGIGAENGRRQLT